MSSGMSSLGHCLVVSVGRLDSQTHWNFPLLQPLLNRLELVGD